MDPKHSPVAMILTPGSYSGGQFYAPEPEPQPQCRATTEHPAGYLESVFDQLCVCESMAHDIF